MQARREQVEKKEEKSKVEQDWSLFLKSYFLMSKSRNPLVYINFLNSSSPSTRLLSVCVTQAGFEHQHPYQCVLRCQEQ